MAQLLVRALQQRGLSEAAARERIWMVDSKGLITTDRSDLSPQKAQFARDPSRLGASWRSGGSSGGDGSGRRRPSKAETMQQLAGIVQAVQPTALIGAAAVAGAFGQAVLEALVQVRPSRQSVCGWVGLNGSRANVKKEAREPVACVKGHLVWPRWDKQCSGRGLWAHTNLGALSHPSQVLPDRLGVAGLASACCVPQSTRSVAGPSARPIVFALSNPTDKAEVSFEDALAWTGGAAVYASGSPFPAITTAGGRTLRPAQANNCFVFSGLAQGILSAGGRRVDDRLLLVAAEAIAGEGTEGDDGRQMVSGGRLASDVVQQAAWTMHPMVLLAVTGLPLVRRHADAAGAGRGMCAATHLPAAASHGGSCCCSRPPGVRRYCSLLGRLCRLLRAV